MAVVSEVPAQPDLPPDGQRYKRLPPPVRFEDLRTTHDVTPPHDPENEAWRELTWLLRVAGMP